MRAWSNELEAFAQRAFFEVPSALAFIVVALHAGALIWTMRWKSSRSTADALRASNFAWGAILCTALAFLLQFVQTVPGILQMADLVPQGGHVVMAVLLNQYEDILRSWWVAALGVLPGLGVLLVVYRDASGLRLAA